MIAHYDLTLALPADSAKAAQAYPLYAWLLSTLPREEGDALHEQGARPISQYLYWDRAQQQAHWRVTLLEDSTIELLDETLMHAPACELHSGAVPVVARKRELIENAEQLLARAEALDVGRAALEFCAPTAFKQGGRYAIFPQERLLVQSLMNAWELCFPEMSLRDEDALELMAQGLHITDYRLHTVRHSLKGNRLPAFLGQVVVTSKLPAPLQAVWAALLCLAPYCGMGIKTALGMGGVAVTLSEKT